MEIHLVNSSSRPSISIGRWMSVFRSPFLLTHAVLPAIALTLWSGVFMALGGDFAIADAVFSLQNHTWSFRESWLAVDVIHAGGRALSMCVWMLVVLVWACTFLSPKLRQWRRALAYLILATLAGVAVASALKATSNMDCPWDLTRYGGTRAYFSLFSARPEGLSRGGCFPAGHSSAGYCWIALYFFLAKVRPRLRFWGLAAGLVTGFVFGVSQQFRGAHFLSHDVWTLAICWFSALALYLAMFGQPDRPPHLKDQIADGR